MKPYPLKFVPIVKDKIWGGTRLKTLLNKDLTNMPNGGESWEISSVDGCESVIADGPMAGKTLTEAIEEWRERLVGKSVYEKFGAKFPLLIKYIDANDDLSIQVHPDDNMARQRHNSNGKTEMWYVIDAAKDACLISGFSKIVSANDYETLLKTGHFVDTLGKYNVKKGDVFFMPAGRIHAIGKGVMVAEIQQTSDITYRVFDYDRRDARGNTRELHVEEAKEAINFNDRDSGRMSYKTVENKAVNVVNCRYFSTSVVAVSGETDIAEPPAASCIILMCVDGNSALEADGEKYRLDMGETIMLPAEIKNAKVRSENCKLLRISIP